MGLRPVMGDVALASALRGANTYVSGPIANAGQASWVTLSVHATAVGGTPTLNASLEQSANGTDWSAITGSGIAEMSAAGNDVATALVTANYVRVTATVAGTDTPTVTFAACVDALLGA